MGIPSYYKKLLEKHPRLVSSSCPAAVSSLYFDFNCLIYHVARGPKMPPYPGDDQKDEWEAILLDEIQRYIVQVWTEAGRPSQVFLAVDGVVPMAKIRQQRLRRFKSAWLVQEEIREGIRENRASWDTNCITPGTAFMEKLGNALAKLCSLRKGWSVSDSSEPGEGEHKIMECLRLEVASQTPILVYGLDADLIVLTMLNAKSPAFLMRERSEMGAVQTDSLGKEEYSFFSIDTLRDILVPTKWKGQQEEWICNYIVGMSLLGNDFLPHSCSINIKTNGHTLLLSCLDDIWSQGKRLCGQVNGRWETNLEGLRDLIDVWASQEEYGMAAAFRKKIQLQGKVTTYNQMERRPLEWAVERLILKRGTPEQGWYFVNGWKDIYREHWLGLTSPETVSSLCGDYVYGLQWTLDYYTGQTSVPMTWYFSRSLSPLWCDLASYLKQDNQKSQENTVQDFIAADEQLAMVLPLESWHLIRNKKHLRLPQELPMFWPKHFDFLSVGRAWLWECEPKIPILTLQRLRQITERNTASQQ